MAVDVVANEVLLAASANLGQTILAVGALGTAAYGLVDVSKAMWGGISNAGFGHVRKSLSPYGAALNRATGAEWPDMLRAHWLNGRSKDDQKCIAKALIRLGLSTDTAEPLAKATRVDPAALTAVAVKLNKGEGLVDADLNVLGRFDAVLESQLDAAFEKADQQYRSAARGLAAVLAVVLAMIAVSAPFDDRTFSWPKFWLALVVGVIAVPLAPIAKDLASALSAAVKAVRGGAA